jgi:tetratricopeptide (TPR) repeat protein
LNSQVIYVEHLVKQIKFLERSIQSYDDGFLDEGVRIATVIRILVHNTPRSTSLLKLLNATSIKLSASGREPSLQAVWYMGMGQAKLENGMISYVPNLSPLSPENQVPVSQWWNQVVMIIDKGQRITRKQIVLGAANKDGGAHVDSKLDKEYESLTREGVMGTIYHFKDGVETNEPTSDVHLLSLRQMAHELLHSPELLKLANYVLTATKQKDADVQKDAELAGGDAGDEAEKLGRSLDEEARAIFENDLNTAYRLWQQAGEKFQHALSIKPDKYEAANNWGNALVEEAKAISINDLAAACRLWQLAGEKYQQALSIKPGRYTIICNWGIALALEARAIAASDLANARKKWQQAGEKFQQALGLKPDMHEIASKWGVVLIHEASALLHVDSVQVDLLLDQAESLLLKHVEHAPSLVAYNLACVYGIRGDVGSSLHWLKASHASNALPTCEKLQTDPDLDAIRLSSEFVDWLHSVCP